MDKDKLKSLLISTDSTIKQAMQKLSETAEKIVFVVGAGDKLLGTITDGDIRRGIIKGTELTVPVREIMKEKFISITDSGPNTIKKAKKLMQLHQIGELPVLDGKGVITDVIFWIDLLSYKAPLQTQILRENPVVIMAGGKGTRLDPFTKILPKPLIPLGEKPIIEHIMDHFYKNGFYRFILILNYKKEMIKVYFSENKLPYKLKFVEEPQFCGTAGGLALIKNKIKKEPFIVTNCDTILTGDYADFLTWHEDKKNLMTIVGTHREITIPYGVLKMKNDVLLSMDEKPKFDMFINTGTYIIDPSVLDSINENEYLDMDKLIIRIKEGHPDRLGVYPHWGGWLDVGQWEEYRKSLRELGVE